MLAIGVGHGGSSEEQFSDLRLTSLCNGGTEIEQGKFAVFDFHREHNLPWGSSIALDVAGRAGSGVSFVDSLARYLIEQGEPVAYRPEESSCGDEGRFTAGSLGYELGKRELALFGADPIGDGVGDVELCIAPGNGGKASAQRRFSMRRIIPILHVSEQRH